MFCPSGAREESLAFSHLRGHRRSRPFTILAGGGAPYDFWEVISKPSVAPPAACAHGFPVGPAVRRE
jgi:hypothetical protein